MVYWTHFLIVVIFPFALYLSLMIETYPMAPTIRKLSPETLRRNGIVIEMDISEDGWPDEIAQIRDRILSFDCIIPPKQDARSCLEPHLLKRIYKELPQAKRDGWFNGEMACNEESFLGQNEAKPRHLENLEAAYNLYEQAVELERKGGMESKVGDKLADYVFKEWKKHADETSISSAHSRFDSEFATMFGRDTELFSQAWHVRNDWHSQCSVAEPLHEGQMLSIPKPDWYFGFPIHNDIRFPRKTDKGETQAVFSLTNLSLLEESEALQSCPLMSLDKYCADIKKSLRNLKDHKLTCYPWAVVEAKRPGVSPQEIRTCYYQVANSSSACVALLRGLSDSPAHDYHHPVVALTFVGGNARVFLTYAEPLVGADCDDDDDDEYDDEYDDKYDDKYDDEDDDEEDDDEEDDDEEDDDEEDDDDDDDDSIILYRMRCIWEGRLDILWNALQLRRMLDTIHYWALQKYRTDIDSDIRRRLRKYRPTSKPSTPSSFRQAEEQGHSRTSPSPLANKRGNRPARPALDNIKSPSILVGLLEQLDVNSAPLEFESSPRKSKKIATRG